MPSLVVAAVAFFVSMTLLWAIPFDAAGLLSLGRALLGICGLVCVALVLARTPAAGLFALLGTYSLEIYLAHPLWGTAARAVLLRSGVRSPLAFVVSGVSIGIVGSLAMALLSRRLKFPYLFRWPSGGRAAIGSQN